MEFEIHYDLLSLIHLFQQFPTFPVLNCIQLLLFRQIFIRLSSLQSHIYRVHKSHGSWAPLPPVHIKSCRTDTERSPCRRKVSVTLSVLCNHLISNEIITLGKPHGARSILCTLAANALESFDAKNRWVTKAKVLQVIMTGDFRLPVGVNLNVDSMSGIDSRPFNPLKGYVCRKSFKP